MRFLTRAIIGLIIIFISISLLSVGIINMKNAMKIKEENSGKKRFERERVFSAYVDTLKSESIVPKITAYGEAKSWRSLELRATNSGKLVFLSENFREGGEVTSGDLLFKIDSSDFEDALEVSKVDLLEAETELLEAEASLLLVKEDLKSAKQQLKLRKSALMRKIKLENSDIVTTAAVENAQLLVSNAKLTLTGREKSFSQANNRISKALISVTRAKISVEKSKRQINDSEYRAPFDGIISTVSVVPGRLLSKNDQLGVLIDPSALEVGFHVSNSEFSRLLDQTGNLISLSIKIRTDIEGKANVLSGVIQRAGAEVSKGTSGRKIFATIQENHNPNIRSGDFLIIEIDEPELSGVSVVPATALNSDGEMLLLKEDNRLEEYLAEIVRRQDDMIILKDAPFERTYVSQRSPQLSPGIKIKPILTDKNSESHRGFSEKSSTEVEMVELDGERLEKLLEFVTKNNRMPDDVKDRIVRQLNGDKVSYKLVSRLERRMEER